MKQSLALLGATGSVGKQALQVVRDLRLQVAALAAHSDIVTLENQIREFKPQLVAVFDFDAAKRLKIAVGDMDVKVLSGMEGLCAAAQAAQADVVLNAVVGMVGLQPTLAAIDAGKDLALANKETLVAGGALVMREAQKKGVQILPVDSEHSAIFQCLQGVENPKAVRRLVLTASGGPFFGKTKEELRRVTPQQALRHPNWKMGAKITIDSATMMNKGLEVIEASWLFHMPGDQIGVVVHRESVIHSLVELVDGASLAQLGVPDMRIPIQYALSWPERYPSPVPAADLVRYGTLTFYEPDWENFPCLGACYRALARGGLIPAAVNGANEEAVALFLEGKISFCELGELAAQAAEMKLADTVRLDSVLQADKEARAYIASHAKRMR